MAHELLIENGQAAMFYVEETPWHELGRRLDTPPTSKDAIEAAGLDWTVAKVPLYVAARNRLHEVQSRFALVREDKLGAPDCEVFGIVGRDYHPLQNSDAFEFFDPIITDEKATYETAGALGHGERVWIQARLGNDFEVASGDIVQRFLLLSNSHDGKSSVHVKLTPIRVVCNNTLTAALAKGRSIQVRHDRDMDERLEEAKRLLGLIEEEYGQLETMFRQMAATPLDRHGASRYFAQVFPSPLMPKPHGRWTTAVVGLCASMKTDEAIRSRRYEARYGRPTTASPSWSTIERPGNLGLTSPRADCTPSGSEPGHRSRNARCAWRANGCMRCPPHKWTVLGRLRVRVRDGLVQAKWDCGRRRGSSGHQSCARSGVR